mgnify:FL=1|jgi:dTMP kinase
MLIAFEGGEGSGKGTQIKLLKKFLEDKGYSVLDIIEPGGTPVGKEIRSILLEKEGLGLLGITEAFLFSASRSQQVRSVTRPALKEGKIVLSDRSFYSTYAYQGYGREQSLSFIQQLTALAVEDTVPDIVILLDIPPEVGLLRKKDQKEFNRLDAESLEFHNRVRSGYLTLARGDPYTWKIINAQLSVSEIHLQVVSFILNYLK